MFQYEDENEYKYSGIANENYTNFIMKNHIRGWNEKLDLCEMMVKSGWSEVFSGFFTCLETNTYFAIPIKIKRKKIISSNEKLNITLKSFEKYFEVYSEDEGFARKFITEDLMKFLVEFYEKYNLDFEIVFKEKFIYMRFFADFTFCFDLYNERINKGLLYTYMCILSNIKEVMSEFRRLFCN